MAKGHRSQIKKERNLATKEKRPQATAKNVGIPASKAKIVLDQIKGKDVTTAAAMLDITQTCGYYLRKSIENPL